MTPLLERIIDLIAPHSCISCGNTNNAMCSNCVAENVSGLGDFCAVCGSLSFDYRICKQCQANTPLKRIWLAAQYKGLPSRLIKIYKFERCRSAYKPLAYALDGIMSHQPSDTLVVPIPTAPRRVIQRGYDHSVLLAKELARLRGLKIDYPLLRRHNMRQVGTSRAQRKLQADTAFVLKENFSISSPVLLVDDVFTTGSTLTAAAELLIGRGATKVEAAVVAWQAPKKLTKPTKAV